jgi:hypothetical protein
MWLLPLYTPFHHVNALELDLEQDQLRYVFKRVELGPGGPGIEDSAALIPCS